MIDGSSKAIIAMFVGSLLTCVGVWYGGRGHTFLGWCAILSGGFVFAFGTYSLCISLTERYGWTSEWRRHVAITEAIRHHNIRNIAIDPTLHPDSLRIGNIDSPLDCHESAERKQGASHSASSGNAGQYIGETPIFALFGAMALFFGVPAWSRGWRRGPGWLFICGWICSVAGGTALWIWCVSHIGPMIFVSGPNSENASVFCGFSGVSAATYGRTEDAEPPK